MILPVPMLDCELPEGSHSDGNSHLYISSSQHTFVEEMNDKFETNHVLTSSDF